MAARVSSSAILRSAVLTHIGLSATSLLCSTCGPPQWETSDELPPQQPPPPSSSPPRQRRDTAAVRAALPWLDQLQDLITGLYVGGVHERGVAHDARVRIGADVVFENPLVSYAGAGETERAFRRNWRIPSNDVRTVIECVGVVASEDSIAGGGQHHAQQNGTSLTSLVSIPSTIMSSRPFPPKVEVTYKLSQHYGAFFSTVSFLVVTVQVKRGDSSPRVRKMSRQNVAVPLATSGFTTRAASTVVAAASHAGPVSVALAQAASHLAARRRDSSAEPAPRRGAAPLVAEVARIEERWNGVQLLGLAPFHWSRRLNGVCVGGAAFLFLNER